jgi:hypothetical protein
VSGDETLKRTRDLKVFAFPQNNGYVPSIRVAGKWLYEMGFVYGDRVTLTAENGIITILRKQPDNELTSSPSPSPD